MNNTLVSGHLGFTIVKISQPFYLYELRDDLNLRIKTCDACAANKIPSKTIRAPLGDLRVGEPLDRILMDVLVPLPKAPRGISLCWLLLTVFLMDRSLCPT